jgi:hypothetical protein
MVGRGAAADVQTIRGPGAELNLKVRWVNLGSAQGRTWFLTRFVSEAAGENGGPEAEDLNLVNNQVQRNGRT